MQNRDSIGQKISKKYTGKYSEQGRKNAKYAGNMQNMQKKYAEQVRKYAKHVRKYQYAEYV